MKVLTELNFWSMIIPSLSVVVTCLNSWLQGIKTTGGTAVERDCERGSVIDYTILFCSIGRGLGRVKGEHR